MKTLTRSLMLTALISTSALAQAGIPAAGNGSETSEAPMRGMHMSPEQHTALMKQELGLSDEQTGAVAELNQRYAARKREMHEQAQAQRKERWAKAKAMMGDRDTELRQILNEEQYARLEAQRQEQREMRGKHNGKHQQHRTGKMPSPTE